jgi:tRNA A-37 threonylcarbamoyl transferase component Bud32
MVGTFRIEHVLESGATGSVYLARDANVDRVALKVMSPELGADERFRRRFARESEIARALDHPAVVPTLAAGEADGVFYLAMRYVDGVDLRSAIHREGRLEPHRAVALLGQVAGALDAAHANGLVHRDVKPANILVAAGPDGEQAFVCDFGLARHLSSPSSLTGDRGFVGTVDFVSPEQIEGGPIDGRADVYSLGGVLFACLTAQAPFDRETELAVVYAHLNEPPPKVSELRPELPAALDHVVSTALAKRPADRYSTCGEFVRAAQAALDGVPAAPKRRRRLAATIAAGLAVAVVAALGGFLAFGPEAHAASITSSSIAGARLGLTAPSYERRFGRPWRWSTQPESGHRILTFPNRGISVYFKGFTDTAVEIVTWNGAYRTAEGIGPCSTVAAARKTFGSGLKPSPFNTQHGVVSAYLLSRNLIFADDGTPPTVTAVALFYGDAPGADQHGGALPYAAFLAIGAATSCLDLTPTS